ncbi:amine oxidase [Ophiostoma piceae UAMH 11346]|uniref:Amine oxidase n=1 Tax=Ophiostoma piceae (strain UAMH 11346) TaxID=1262450 RepID=S3CE05_OPHP1|nr:amine oxidase [Ophiostoma piceae UAMH 11346]
MRSILAPAAVVAQLALCAAATPCKPASLNGTASAWLKAYPGSARKDVDVVVVGGGSAGSNAAIHLYDAGLDILLIEAKPQLGGMVDSYTNPETGNVFDFGVATYTNLTGTEAYFERLGLSTKIPTFATTVPYYADFTTGETVAFEAPDLVPEFAALAAYYEIAKNYSELFMPSYANWPAPDEIPEDLLLPFGEFAAKYELNDTMLLLWAGIGAGLADMLSIPTIFMMQTFGPQTAGVFLGNTVQFVPESGRNQDIYDSVTSILGDAVMVNSKVTKSVRLPDNGGAALLVQDQVTGSYTVVTAKRLVIAFEPTSDNTAPFGLDAQETAVFNKGTWSIVHTGIVSHPSLPDEALIYNLPPTAVNGNDFAFPEPPFVDFFQYMGDDLYQVIVVGWEGFSIDDAQTMAQEALQNLASSGTINATDGVDLTIKSWSNHGPMDMRTSREELEGGFIQDLYALQGHRSTYWTGAAFSSQLSTYLWYYNLEYLVPLVVDSL